MTKSMISTACLATAIFVCSCGAGNPTHPVTPNSGAETDSALSVKLDFSGPTVSPSSVYACWIENETGVNVKNLYVCARVTNDTLTGDALPLWKTVKYAQNDDIDGVSGASIQGAVGLSVTRKIPAGFPSKFRVYFEIDRSLNANTYFTDRPSMIFRSELIDASALSSSPFPLTAYAWMANDTEGEPYGQNPKTTIPDFETYKLMTDLSWIADTGDMVSSLSVTVSETDD